MLAHRSVTAVIPTRGNVDCGRIYDQLRIYPEIGAIHFVIGNTPFNRYRTMLQLEESQILLTQDDDCLTDMRPLLDAYDPDVIVNAMTPEHAKQYPGRQTLIGFGALFHRSMLLCFLMYPWERDELFYRESDRIFPTVNPHKTVFPDIEILPHANDANRLWKQPDHLSAKAAINQRIFEVTGIRA